MFHFNKTSSEYTFVRHTGRKKKTWRSEQEAYINAALTYLKIASFLHLPKYSAVLGHLLLPVPDVINATGGVVKLTPKCRPVQSLTQRTGRVSEVRSLPSRLLSARETGLLPPNKIALPLKYRLGNKTGRKPEEFSVFITTINLGKRNEISKERLGTL